MGSEPGILEIRDPYSVASRAALWRLEMRDTHMQDLLMLLFTAVFFALAFLYVKACQKLR
jgi:hypothetical protein